MARSVFLRCVEYDCVGEEWLTLSVSELMMETDGIRHTSKLKLLGSLSR
jgi:hypothetical protein